MNFKDLLDRYKDGTLDEKTCSIVQAELEKNEAINEYLADEIDKNLGFNMSEDSYEENHDHIDKIKKSVDQRFRKNILISVVSVLLMLFIGRYVISPTVAALYYNPKKESVCAPIDDIYCDLKTYIELYRPGFALIHVSSVDNGYGSYNLNIHDKNLFTGDSSHSSVGLVRNKLQGSFDFLMNKDYPLYNVDRPTDEIANFLKNRTEKSLSYLRELPEQSNVSAFVSFNKSLDMKGLYELIEAYEKHTLFGASMKISWVGVDCGDYSLTNGRHIGFDPNFNSGSSISEMADQDKYPILFMDDLNKANHKNNKTYWSESEYHQMRITAYESHFKSMVRYLYDRKQFSETFSVRSDSKDFYKTVIDYTDKNGVNSYGVLVFGKPENIIQFMGEDFAEYLSLYNIDLSLKL